MKFFVDTANVEDIKKANDMGVICGVTTNPSLIAKEGREIAKLHPNMVVKIPMTVEGLKATKVLASE